MRRRIVSGMSDPSDPPRKFFDLKPRDFERVNGVPPPTAADVPAADPGIAPAPASGPIDVKDLFRQAQVNAPLLSKSRSRGPENEVHGILRNNHERATAAGLNDLAPKAKRISRRRRHYWISMIVGTALFGSIIIGAGPSNPIFFIYGLAGLVLYNVGLWWSMWHVLDDY